MIADERTLKAITIARTSASWRPLTSRDDGEVLYAIPSQTTRGLFYLVTETTCTCLDYEHNGLREGLIGSIGLHCLCKHIRAVHLKRMEHEAANDGLVLKQLPSGEYAWLRPELSQAELWRRFEDDD